MQGQKDLEPGYSKMGSFEIMKMKGEMSPVHKNFARLSLAIILAYALRVTIPSIWINTVSPKILDLAGFVFLFIALTSLFLGANLRLQPMAVLMIACVATSSALSPYYETALIRSILWIIVFVAAGPVIISKKAYVFRNYLWHHSIYVIYVIVVASFVWNTFGLPIYGKGVAGVTAHCMLLGALAGIAATLSFHALLAQSSRSLIYWGVFTSSTLTCLLSGSRAAVLAAMAGCAVLFITRLGNIVTRTILTVMTLLIAMLIWSLFDLGESDTATIANTSLGALTPYASELIKKGASNTREELWANRLAEFKQNPLTGIGIGVQLYTTKSTIFSKDKNIEPGSSYLTTLSMTGLMGGICLLMLLAGLVNKIDVNSYEKSDLDIAQAFGVGAFWAVHAIAEGWIFAGGSILCLFFWIWVGRLTHFRASTYREEKRDL